LEGGKKLRVYVGSTKLFFFLGIFVMVLIACAQQASPSPSPAATATPKAEASPTPTTTGPVDKAAELQKVINEGKYLWPDTSLGTNGKSCEDCHPQGGNLDNPAEGTKRFYELGRKYPGYWAGSQKVYGLDQVINYCIVNGLAGQPLDWDDPRLTKLVAYAASVKAGPPPGPPGDDAQAKLQAAVAWGKELFSVRVAGHQWSEL